MNLWWVAGLPSLRPPAPLSLILFGETITKFLFTEGVVKFLFFRETIANHFKQINNKYKNNSGVLWEK